MRISNPPSEAPLGRRAQAVLDQREQILDAARRLFADHGSDRVTMARVASEAGVARATVFNHFGSKHALVECITEVVLTYYQSMLDNALAAEGERSEDLVRALFDFMGYGVEAERAFYRSVFREFAKLRVGLSEGGPVERARRGTRDRLVRLMLRGQARGELSSEHRAEDLADALDNLVNGTITHWLYDEATEPLRERMRRAAEIFLAPVAVGSDHLEERPLPDIAPAPHESPGVIRAPRPASRGTQKRSGQ